MSGTIWIDEDGSRHIVPPWCREVIGQDEFPFRDREEVWYSGPIARCPWPRRIEFQPGATRADDRCVRMHAAAMRRCAYAAALRDVGMTFRDVGEELGCGARRAGELVKRWQEFVEKGDEVSRRRAQRGSRVVS